MGLRYYTTSCNIRSKSLTCRHIQSRQLRGQTLAEYALILAFVSVVAIATLLSMGSQVSTVFTDVNRQLNTANNGGTTTAARTH